jgi:hypothetical protein
MAKVPKSLGACNTQISSLKKKIAGLEKRKVMLKKKTTKKKVTKKRPVKRKAAKKKTTKKRATKKRRR